MRVLPDYDRMLADTQQDILSEIEDFCIIFGTDALPALRDYIARATKDWTARPDYALVEDTPND